MTLRDVFSIVKGFFLGFLILLFAIVLCITHPIFVFTTACSLTVTFCKLSYALSRRFLKRLFTSSKDSEGLPLEAGPTFPDGFDFTSYFKDLDRKKSFLPQDTFDTSAPITLEK